MSELVYPCQPELSNSTIGFESRFRITTILEMERLFTNADSDVKRPLPYLFPWTKLLKINDRVFCILIIPQHTGRFVARTSTSNFNATGQGDTEEEALRDIKEAIELLIEEANNPSGDAQWPEDFQ